MSIAPRLDKAGKYEIAWIPAPDFAGQHVDLAAPRAGVLHTMEGSLAGSERVFAVHYAPHFALGPDPQGRPRIVQHVPIGTIGAACRAHNALAIVEVEIAGFSKETPWLPDPLVLDMLASLMVACEAAYGIPLSHPWPDGDFGRAGRNPHRDSGRFGHVAGWFGHGDMPSPDTHWDPGNLEWSKVFAHARALKTAAEAGAETRRST